MQYFLACQRGNGHAADNIVIVMCDLSPVQDEEEENALTLVCIRTTYLCIAISSPCASSNLELEDCMNPD